MATHRKSPGPAAHAAFRTGIFAAIVLGLAVIGSLYWLGELSLLLAGYCLLVVFPVYLVVVASVLSVWLGYNKDSDDLRPVYREKA